MAYRQRPKITAFGAMSSAESAGRRATSDAEAAMRRNLKYKDPEAKAKESFTWLKDAYTFAKNNKEYLDDPEVQSVLMAKLHKLEKTGFFTPAYRKKEPMDVNMLDLTSGSMAGVNDPQDRRIAGPSGGMELDPLKTIEAMYDRFMQENPNIYKPHTQETMGSATPGGPQVPGTQRIDPLAPQGTPQQSQFFQAPPQTYKEGDVIGQPQISPTGEMGIQQFGKIGKTATPAPDKPQFGGIHLDEKTGRWGQFGPDNKFVPITTATELAAQTRGKSDQDIPNSVYNNNLNNAIKDAVDGADAPGILERVYNWFMGKDPAVFEEIIKPRLDTYNDYYRRSQGKKTPKKTEKKDTKRRKPLGSHFTTNPET